MTNSTEETAKLNLQIWKERKKNEEVTADEIAFLQSKTDEFGFSFEHALKLKKSKDTDVIYNTGFNGSQVGFCAEILLAIRNLYDNQGFKIYFDIEGNVHLLTKSKAKKPQSFIAHRWQKSISERAEKRIIGYIQTRFQEKSFDSNQFHITVLEFFNDTEYMIDPFKKGIDLAVQEILDGKRRRIGFNEFYNDLSQGITPEIEEPYRKKSIELLRKAPLIIRDENYNGEGFQNMVIFVGPQGIGKSTLVKHIAIGYYDVIDDFSDVRLENAIKRRDNVALESAELSHMKKSEIEKQKAAITRRSIKTQLKYKNEITEFPCYAMIIGTTNDYDFLMDMTGERRFLPIAIKTWDESKITYDYMLSVYATVLVEFGEKGNYHDMIIAQKALDKNKKLLLRMGIDSVGKLNFDDDGKVKTDDDFTQKQIQTLDEIQVQQTKLNIAKRQLQKEEFNLNVVETEEDLQYKNSLFGQADPTLEALKEVLTDALTDNKDLYNALIIKKDLKSGYYVFKSKATLEKELRTEIENRHPDMNVYSSKLSNWILNIGQAGFKRINKKSTRVILISINKIRKILHLEKEEEIQEQDFEEFPF